jgi:hypothetical protein
MEWGRCHWLDNLTRILQKFESGQMDKYLFFYKICKFTDQLKKIKRFFLKKILRGPVPAELGRFGGVAGPLRSGARGRPIGRMMSMHASVLVDSVGPPSAEVCRAAASFP